jgi:transcription initiation factor IIE alpha subunit
LSDLAADVLEVKAENPEVLDSEIRSKLGIKQRQVNFALREIQKEFLIAMGEYPKSSRAPYAIYEDEYYSRFEDRDDQVVLFYSGKSFSAPKDKVRIETEMSYRTPFHFTASMVM